MSAEAPWATVGRVNAEPLAPGDSVLFKRGDTWREQLVPRSGNSNAPVTYAAYGTGPKPLLLGSVAKNGTNDWISEHPGIWTAGRCEGIGPNRFTNSSFTHDLNDWGFWQDISASAVCFRNTNEYHSAPACLTIVSSNSGTASHQMQLFAWDMAIDSGQGYQLSFFARCDKPFLMPSIQIHQNGEPWATLCPFSTPASPITTNWTRHVMLFKATATDPRGRITFYLGGGLPDGSILDLDDFTLQATAPSDLFFCDVGNIIFDHGTSCGIKVWEESDLDAPGEFWYDESNWLVRVCFPTNPALARDSIECALSRHIVDQNDRSHVHYNGLDLRYGGAHGIGGGNTEHIQVSHCDISFIGGGDQIGGAGTLRYGNGIEFWGNARNHLVDSCRLWQIYDAALTAQSDQDQSSISDILFRNNVISNCEYSFEFWNQPESSCSSNIVFENNTCLYAGGGWGHDQRPDPNGAHLMFFLNSAQTTNLIIRNNIFSEASEYLARWDSVAQCRRDIVDFNAWHQRSTNALARIEGTWIPFPDFDLYRQTTGHDAHSLFTDPRLNAQGALLSNSPCINAGIQTDWMADSVDMAGNRRIIGPAPDLGAYEYLLTPTNLVAATNMSGSCLQLTWSAVNGAGGYAVFRSTNNVMPPQELTTVQDAAYCDGTAQKGVPYYYWVNAHYLTDASAASSSVLGWLRKNGPLGWLLLLTDENPQRE